MSPPIRDGSGSSIGSIRLGDGSEISEVRTGAGDVLFSATRDVSFLDSPVLQYSAGAVSAADGSSPVDFPEVLSGTASAATAIDDPVFRNNFNSSGAAAIEYDNGANATEDEHETTPSAVPDNGGQITILATFLATDNSGIIAQFGGNPAALELSSGTVTFQVDGSNSFTGGSINTGQLTTCGLTYDDSTGAASVFDPVQETTDSTSVDLSTDALSFGFGTVFDPKPFGGGIVEIVICDTVEPLANYDAYDTARTS